MWSKALSMSASSLEIFRTLGIADRLIELGTPLYEAHFGGVPQRLNINYDVIRTRYSFNLQLPQLRTEGEVLERCEEVGIRCSWGLRFSSFSQTGTGVSACFHNLKLDLPSAGALEELETIEATWLIGCDGTQSAVREAAGIIFNGPRASHYAWLADGDCDPDAPPFWKAQESHGRAILATLGDRTTARRFIGPVPPLTTDEKPTALDESQVRERIEKAFGTHYNFHNLTWSSVVGNGMRLAETYRSGRVFIAGDAAHQLFPAGGQGMNTGLLDAANLAWKLAAVITTQVGADAIEIVLDSYTAERRTSVQAVIYNIRVQMQVAFEQTRTKKRFLNLLRRRWANQI